MVGRWCVQLAAILHWYLPLCIKFYNTLLVFVFVCVCVCFLFSFLSIFFIKKKKKSLVWNQ